MSDRLGIDQQNRKRIEDWLLALLRFAITRDSADRKVTVELARQMDAGEAGTNRSLTYFVRTTVEMCQAIALANNRRRAPILRRYLVRIENPGLGKAFRAAVGLEEADAPRLSQATSREYLWNGLPPPPASKS